MLVAKLSASRMTLELGEWRDRFAVKRKKVKNGWIMGSRRNCITGERSNASSTKLVHEFTSSRKSVQK